MRVVDFQGLLRSKIGTIFLAGANLTFADEPTGLTIPTLAAQVGIHPTLPNVDSLLRIADADFTRQEIAVVDLLRAAMAPPNNRFDLRKEYLTHATRRLNLQPTKVWNNTHTDLFGKLFLVLDEEDLAWFRNELTPADSEKDKPHDVPQ